MSSTPLLANPDAEVAVLGLWLTQPDGYARYPLSADAFSTPTTRALHAAVRALAEQGERTDVTLVAAVAAKYGGSAADAFEAAELAPPTLGAGAALVATLIDCQRRRAMQRAGRVLTELALTADVAPEASIGQHLEWLTQATATVSPLEAPTADVAGVEWLTALAEAEQQATRAAAVLTGQRRLDTVLGDLARGEVCVVAARPGIGKSALGTQVAAWNARRRLHVLFASAEMPRRQVLRRLYAMLASVPLAALRANEAHGIELTEDEWQRVRTTTLPQDLRLFERAAMTSDHVVDMALRVAVARPLDLVVVDHLHHLADRGTEKRHEVLGRMMLSLKALAVRHRAAVLVLAQLNREGSDVPTLRHLREAGAIEELASAVVLLHRPKPEEPVVEAHVAKNRDGEVGLVALEWEGRFVRFAS